MTKYLAGVLTVIAAGVLLIAYGLLAPRTQAAFMQDGRALMVAPAAADGVGYQTTLAGVDQFAQPVALRSGVVMPRQAVEYVDAPAVRRTALRQAPRQSVRAVSSKPKRTWQKTALIIGGSSATGAGVGALIGGKKGALIGAAIGGGAGTLYETTKR